MPFLSLGAAIAAGGDGYDPNTGLYNATPQTLGRFLAAMNRQFIGGGACKIVVMGGLGGYGTSSKAYWPVRQMTSVLDASGQYGSVRKGTVYFTNLTNNQDQRDERIVTHGDWANTNGGPDYTGAFGSNVATPMEIAYEGLTDSFTFVYARNSGSGTLHVVIDGNAPIDIATAGAEAIGSTTVTVDLDVHSLEFTTTGDVQFWGVRGFNSADPTGVEISGIHGADILQRSMYLFGNGGPNALTHGVIQDLVIIGHYGDVYSGADGIPAYRTLLASMIDFYHAAGADVLLYTTQPAPTPSIAVRDLYQQAQLEVAAEKGCAVLDLYRYFEKDQPKYGADPTNYMNNQMWQTNLGGAFMGRLLANALRSVAGEFSSGGGVGPGAAIADLASDADLPTTVSKVNEALAALRLHGVVSS